MNIHGHMSFSWQDDLFIIEVEGPFNVEGVKHWFLELKKSVEEQNIDVWRRLEVWDDNVLGSAESRDIGESIYDWYESNGCKKAAIVVSNGIQEYILQNMPNEIEVFKDETSAREWLNQKN